MSINEIIEFIKSNPEIEIKISGYLNNKQTSFSSSTSQSQPSPPQSPNYLTEPRYDLK